MKLVFATHNQNKFNEVKVLMPKHIELLSLTDIGCTQEIPETGTTLEENAQLKSNFVVKTYGLNCFSDDTGLLVDALNEAPGVYSARYAGEAKNAQANMNKLLNELKAHENRSAKFETVVSLHWQGKNHLFIGAVHGTITNEKRGDKGFGYDPIFIPENYTETFAELPLETKNKISHRGLAIVQLIDFLDKTANSV